jgi:hypothetical protein
MNTLKNPLEILGVPRWFVELELPRGQEGLEAIRRQASIAYRGLMGKFHPESKIEGVTPDTDRAKELSELEESLKDPAVVEVWAHYMIDSGSLYAERARAEAQKVEAHNRDRLHALLAMLPAISPYALLGVDTPQEIVMGMPDELSKGYQPIYDQTFMLRLTGIGEQAGLWLLSHPDRSGSPASFLFAEALTHDGTAWGVNYLDERGGEPVELRHRHSSPVSQGEVRLVGGVAQETLYRFGAQAAVPVESEVRMITSGGFVRTTGLTWRQADVAWWVPAMAPSLDLGDFAVVARGEGDELYLALAGQFMASRPL